MATHKPTTARKKKLTLKRIIIAVIAIVIIAGGVLGYLHYRSTQSNKIYKPGQTMKFQGFGVTVTSAKFAPVDLPLNEAAVKQYGGIATDENCDTFSKVPLPASQMQVLLKENIFDNPSPYNYCIRRNDSRKDLRDYTSKNKQLTVQYTIMSSGTVLTKNFDVQVLPDSGRNPNPKDSPLPGNEMLFDNLSNDMSFNYSFQSYNPYSKSDIGGNVNAGLTRSGTVKTDIRNSEKSVDVTFSYWQGGKRVYKTTRVANN